MTSLPMPCTHFGHLQQREQPKKLGWRGEGRTALPPVRAMAARPQYGRKAASVVTRGAYLATKVPRTH